VLVGRRENGEDIVRRTEGGENVEEGRDECEENDTDRCLVHE
jgi:hypothetical protein